MKQGYFITGTDTSIGKTWATVALMRYFKNQGKTVVGMKPVASGCCIEGGQLRNEDALLIQANASISMEYEDVNPYAFAEPVSPHLAAGANNIDLNHIVTAAKEVQQQADIMLVEGVGGWFVPLNDKDDIACLAQQLKLPVILVVGIRLGCINHALLSYQAIKRAKVPFAGWVAMNIEKNVLMQQQVVDTIKAAISAPLLAELPYVEQEDFDLLSSYFSL